MNIRKKVFTVFLLPVAVVMWVAGISYGDITQGQSAPVFSLKDMGGKSYDLAEEKTRPMIMLYFFDAASRSSQEGLLRLDELAKKYTEVDLKVWGITRSPKDTVTTFVKQARPGFPILRDTEKVSDMYGARFILPVVCIVGPGLKVLDTFKGGGKTMEVMLVRLAERKLQQRRPEAARVLVAEVEKQHPDNEDAKAVSGYAALKAGELDTAEKVFKDMSRGKGKSGIVGKEGLAAVLAQKGKTSEAMALADEVAQAAPERPYPHVIKGNLLYQQQKREAAEAEFEKATAKKDGAPYQQAVGYNQLGRMLAEKGELKKSRQLFGMATDINPYYIEATSNKARTYEKEGNWDQALQTYQQALTVDNADVFVKTLAAKAAEMVAIQNDTEKKARMDKLVKELAERFNSQKPDTDTSADTWTSRPMVLTFVDFQEKGGLPERDGFSSVLTSRLGATLNASGRVKVVERVLLERLLDELNLGSSDLADPETALRLGKVLAAKLIGTGSLFYMPGGTLLNMRLIDSETSSIPKVVTRQLSTQGSMEKDINQLNREILKTVISKYPLQGFVVSAENKEVMINLGASQGVVMGTSFSVIEEKEPVVYKGKTLRSKPKVVGRLEVTSVEPDLSYARIVEAARPLKTDDKIREQVDVSAAM